MVALGVLSALLSAFFVRLWSAFGPHLVRILRAWGLPVHCTRAFLVPYFTPIVGFRCQLGESRTCKLYYRLSKFGPVSREVSKVM